jgi:hypothetical protein
VAFLRVDPYVFWLVVPLVAVVLLPVDPFVVLVLLYVPLGVVVELFELPLVLLVLELVVLFPSLGELVLLDVVLFALAGHSGAPVWAVGASRHSEQIDLPCRLNLFLSHGLQSVIPGTSEYVLLWQG